MKLGEVKNLLVHIIENNKRLQENGMSPVAISLEGMSGIGKTSLVESIVKNVTKRNLQEIEDLADLVGYPSIECLMYERVEHTNEDGKKSNRIRETWVEKNSLQFLPDTFKSANKTRSINIVPKFISEMKEDSVLLLDDYNRASTNIQQAAMELIYKQKYADWSLPKNVTVITTENPDNGEYNVNEEDRAQKGRRMRIKCDFDLDFWMLWAEKNIDERLLNMIIRFPEIISMQDNDIRSITTFSKCISGIEDLSKEIILVDNIAQASLNESTCALIIAEIKNNTEDIIDINEIFSLDESEAITLVRECVFKNGEYKNDIGFVVGTRLINKCIIDPSVEKAERLKSLIVNKLFSEDLVFIITSKLFSANPSIYKVMLKDSQFRDRLLC